MRLLFVKCEEVLVEDLDQCDVFESFYAFENEQVTVIGDDNEELFVLADDKMSFDAEEEAEKIEVPEDYYAHSVGWRTTEFEIILNDENHKLQQSDFTWRWVLIGDYEYQVLDLKEEVGYLEFDSSWDGRYDEVLDIEGRPGPDEEEW